MSADPVPNDACTLLIVDDNEIDRYLLKRFLRGAGLLMPVFEAEHGEQALAFFEQFVTSDQPAETLKPPLVVFLDINMPRKTGLEFLADFARLRQDYPQITSKVVMLSTAERRDEQQLAFSYDFVKGYLKKGAISLQSLSALITGLQQEAASS